MEAKLHNDRMIVNEGGVKRTLKEEVLKTEFAIVGGGMAGVCAAITAARKGVKVVLIQDRPILGGNASSEVRLWMLGATSHMGNNNRWAREGGVIDEILVENTNRNPEGNALILDTILLDKVVAESNITLLLNTAIFEAKKIDLQRIESIKGFCSQNSTIYIIHAPLFCDASGDGILGFIAGAAFRMGAESMQEFGEKFAPSTEYGELLGHSLYFYSKDTGKPVKFVAPGFALKDLTKKIPRFRNFNANESGCKLWWLEYGGRLDTVHDTEKIKWELWKVVYAAWDYIKNSGNFPEAETLTLEWVGTIPGKRESRRFEGDYMLRQQDIVEQRLHEDAVAFGGWSIDLHPADGVFSEKPGCNQWHSKGIYQIPYRCLYSRNISNLFLAGRIISATHVAFASTRVMATVAHAAQAVGLAAWLALRKGVSPRNIYQNGHMRLLQEELLRSGQHIPQLPLQDDTDLVQRATISASSEFVLEELPMHFHQPLDNSLAQMIPLENGKVPAFVFHAEAAMDTILQVELRISSKSDNHTPDTTIGLQELPIQPGHNCLQLEFDAMLDNACYAFIVFKNNDAVSLYFSDHRVSGVLSVFNTENKAVSNFGKQTPTEDIGVDEFEFWCPRRRPEGQNVAFKTAAPIRLFGAKNIATGVYRPTSAPGCWVAELNDAQPYLMLEWDMPIQLKRIELFFDTDFDHPMESVLMTHPESVMPFCIRNYNIRNESGQLLAQVKDNYQTRNTILLHEAINTSKIIIEVEHPSLTIPAAIFGVRCYDYF